MKHVAHETPDRSEGVLTIDGKRPLGSPDGYHFGISQGETFYPLNLTFGSIGTHIPRWTDYTVTLIQLSDGMWIARPIRNDYFTIRSRRFEDRHTALRAAIAQVIRQVRRAARAVDGPEPWQKVPPYYKLQPELARKLVQWAAGLLALSPPPLYMPPEKAEQPAQPVDPVQLAIPGLPL